MASLRAINHRTRLGLPLAAPHLTRTAGSYLVELRWQADTYYCEVNITEAAAKALAKVDGYINLETGEPVAGIAERDAEGSAYLNTTDYGVSAIPEFLEFDEEPDGLFRTSRDFLNHRTWTPRFDVPVLNRRFDDIEYRPQQTTTGSVVYETTSTGQLEKAQAILQEVLGGHPEFSLETRKKMRL